MALSLKRLAMRGGAAILPDDGVVNRAATRTVPDQRRLALVGDAECRDVLRFEIGLRQRRARGAERRRPKRFGIMLDPAGPRENLRKLFLRAGDRLHRR